MKRYYIAASQTTVHPDDEGFATLEEARQALREEAKQEHARCKARWPQAYCAAPTPDLREIRAGRDPQTPLWTRLFIVSW